MLRSCSHEFTSDGRAAIIRRLSQEGIIPFATGIGKSYDYQFEYIARTGNYDSDYDPYLPRGSYHAGGDPCRVLEVLGAFDKLDIIGRVVKPDFDAFLTRSREAENFAGARWEDLLPTLVGYKRWIHKMMGPAPSVVFCKHGPGATAERLTSVDKWIPILDSTRTAHPVLRIVDVPKNFLKRRIIGIEPVLQQFRQQGVANSLRDTYLFRKYVNIHDQSVHADKACTPGLMTIDLKDASDRIPPSLIEALFPSDWVKLLLACSTGYGTLPDGSTLRVGPFAQMGCGYCFEVETLVFLLVVTALSVDGDFSNHHYVESHLRTIAVYGDDIVCSRDLFPAISAFASTAGWVLNQKKTCLTERFKETVGYWIADGVKTLRFTPQLLGDAHSIRFHNVSDKLALASRCYEAGYRQLSSAILSEIGQLHLEWDTGYHIWGVFDRECERDCLRPTNLSDNVRWYVWWKTGRSAPSSEPTGKKTQSFGHVPLRELGQLGTKILGRLVACGFCDPHGKPSRANRVTIPTDTDLL